MSLIESITIPSDIKKLSIAELNLLAKEIRQIILDTVLENGGHLASSLGAVELILAVHYVFDTPYDKLIFDVGHQAYAHKILTGRIKEFSTLRKKGGISGFPKRNESEYDTVNTGHSSTSLSVACGITRGLAAKDSDNIAITIIGDGALTGGLAYEALNDLDDVAKKQVIILNDNAMSISENVGSTAKYLMKLHSNKVYQKLKDKAMTVIDGIDIYERGKSYRVLYKFKKSVKYFLQGGMPFEQFDLRYFGPIDGHNLEQLIKALQLAKEDDDSVILHVVTQKGRGFKEAEENPAKYHGYSPSKPCDCETFSSCFGRSMVEIAEKNDKVFAVTAAMCEGVGLEGYFEKFKNRFADVGIAEAHATTMSVGLALEGLKPYFAVYSSFLQRAYDQVIHDVCLQDLPVTFCIDRAGIVPSDGETHQGIYDTAFLRILPNMTVVAPKNNNQLNAILNWSLDYNHPLAIRYPKGAVCDNSISAEIKLGKWEILKENASKVIVLAFGARMVEEGGKAISILAKSGYECDFVNALFVKPLDKEFLLNTNGKVLVTLEDNLLAGGFGSAVLEFVNKNKINAVVYNYGIEEKVLEHASVAELLSDNNLDADSLAKRIIKDAYEA